MTRITPDDVGDILGEASDDRLVVDPAVRERARAAMLAAYARSSEADPAEQPVMLIPTVVDPIDGAGEPEPTRWRPASLLLAAAAAVIALVVGVVALVPGDERVRTDVTDQPNVADPDQAADVDTAQATWARWRQSASSSDALVCVSRTLASVISDRRPPPVNELPTLEQADTLWLLAQLRSPQQVIDLHRPSLALDAAASSDLDQVEAAFGVWAEAAAVDADGQDENATALGRAYLEVRSEAQLLQPDPATCYLDTATGAAEIPGPETGLQALRCVSGELLDIALQRIGEDSTADSFAVASAAGQAISNYPQGDETELTALLGSVDALPFEDQASIEATVAALRGDLQDRGLRLGPGCGVTDQN